MPFLAPPAVAALAAASKLASVSLCLTHPWPQTRILTLTPTQRSGGPVTGWRLSELDEPRPPDRRDLTADSSLGPRDPSARRCTSCAGYT
ncbi:unnamed protein product [Cutaneotrichosporon oleaginosum]